MTDFVTKFNYKIAVLPGDGIGPEVTDASLRVLDAIGEAYELDFTLTTYDAGAGYYKKTGTSMSETDMVAVGEADAILLGAMGISDVRRPDGTEINPQIELREKYDLFASLRPARLFPGVRSNIRSTDIDILVIRETTEGLFAGRRDPSEPSNDAMSDRLTITRATSEKLFELAFAQAATRRQVHGTQGRVTLLDKANVLKSNAFMRKVFDEVAQRHSDIEAERTYIDAGAMKVVTHPEHFDVVVTENVFGDIVSEVAAGIVGGLGVVPSGDVSHQHGVFQPCHGTAPDIAGTGVANPVAAVLSVGMMLEWLGYQHADERLFGAAAAVRSATAQALASNKSTPDIGGDLSTAEVAEVIVRAVKTTA